MKNHNYFIISSNPFHIDLISGVLWSLPIEGVSESDNFITVYSVEQSGVSQSTIKAELDHLVKENLIESYSVETGQIAEINWNEEWEKSIQPVRVTEKIVIKPSFKKFDEKPGDLVITIDPKMSFGTGEHETTKLILTLLEKCSLENKSVLDLGSGTAVLAIAAAKLGAGKVIAIDNDEWCLINGKENVEQNNVQEKVDVQLGELSQITENNFDLIIANINKNTLLQLAGEIAAKLKPGGTLLLSGLLVDDETEITHEYKKKGCTLIETKTMNEWTALKFTKE